MTSLGRLGEFGLIEKIKSWTPTSPRVVKGIGDDAAVLASSGRMYSCLTTDAVVEGIHFLKRTPAAEVGWKALAVNISDIAAMGAEPEAAVVTLVLPKWVNAEYVRALYRGMLSAGRTYGVNLVGGDTTRGRELVVSITLLGRAHPKHITYRSGAKSGDLIWVTGSLGGSLEGKHLSFKPRLAESRFLVHHFKPNAMMDVSDGLLQDTAHVLKASNKGAEISLDRIPISVAARKKAGKNRSRALQFACTDGEDFELIFTMPARKAEALSRAWKKRFRTKLTAVGRVVNAPKGLRTFLDGKAVRPAWLKKQGFTHF